MTNGNINMGTNTVSSYGGGITTAVSNASLTGTVTGYSQGITISTTKPLDINDVVYELKKEIANLHSRIEILEAAVKAETARCVAICEDSLLLFASDKYAANQPLSSFAERFACAAIAAAIRKE